MKVNTISSIMGQTPEELNRAFANYVSLFKIDPVLEQRMDALLAECQNT